MCLRVEQKNIQPVQQNVWVNIKNTKTMSNAVYVKKNFTLNPSESTD